MPPSVMMGAMRRSRVSLLLLLPVGGSLVGCGLLGGSDGFDDALEVVPASVSEVRFFDREAALERLDVDDLEADPSDEELEEYVEKSREFPAYTALDQYLVPMLESAPFSAQDIVWEVAGYDADGGFGQVWRMDDDLELDDVVDDLVDAGYEEDGAGDGTTLTVELSDIGEDQQYFAAMPTLTVLPDEHLIVTGPLTDDFLEVISDDADSTVDKDTFDDLVDGTDDIEFAALARDDLACRSTRMTPEQLDGLAPLGRPEQTGFVVHGEDGDARSVLLFDDEEAADDDAGAREDYLTEGSNPISAEPFDAYADWEVEADGERVHVDLAFDDARILPAVISRRDYTAFSACGPE